MSGGHWEYMQYRFTDVAEDIDKLIEQNGTLKTGEELKNEGWRNPDWYEKYPEDKYHEEYPPEVLQEFRKALQAIKIAQIYMQRMDWLLSGDDGEESFLRRLQQDLEKLNK